jgi:hypothetical protein
MSRARHRPPVRFFEDLVRLPDHNIVIPKSFATHEQSPRFSSLFQGSLVVRAYSPPSAILVADSREGCDLLSPAGRLLFR